MSRKKRRKKNIHLNLCQRFRSEGTATLLTEESVMIMTMRFIFFFNWFDIEHLYQSPNYSRVQPVSLTLLPSQGELMIHLLSLFIIGFDHQSMLLDVGSMDFIWS